MPDLILQIELQSPSPPIYAPGSSIAGTVKITSPEGDWEAKLLNLVFFWRTSGIGAQDEGVAQSVDLTTKGAHLPAHYSSRFEVRAPLHPWTYHGKLIKINWYVGLYVKTGWRSSQELEVPISIHPALLPNTDGVQPVIFYDNHGRPVTPPSTS